MQVQRRREKMCKGVVREIRNKTIVNYEEIRETANKFIAEYKIKDEKTPIVKIINDAGFKIFEQDLPEEIGGYIVLSGEVANKFGSDKIIVVNEKENYPRQRFSLAHEFAHYLLDEGAKCDIEYSDIYSFSAFESDADKSETEKRMDRFAAELLMPVDIFKNKYTEFKTQYVLLYDICSALADFFAVPPMAVKKRFEEVGISI